MPTIASTALPAYDVPAPPSWGMIFLMVFLLIVIGRIQEVTPALAGWRIGLVTGGIAAFCWALAPGTFQSKVPLEIKQVRYVLMLLGLAVVTIPFSIWPGGSFGTLTEKYWKIVVMFFMALFWCQSLRHARLLIWVCCAGLAILLLAGIFSGQADQTRFNAVSKTYDPNDLALVLAMLLPLALYLFSTSGYIQRIFIIGIVFLFLYGSVLTQSRGGLVALAVVGVLTLRRSALSRTGKLMVTVVAALVFAGLTGEEYWARMQTIWNPQTDYDRTAGARTEVWKTGLLLMATHPWGVGLDGFVTAEGQSHGGVGKWAAAHNSFLQVGAELGVAGLIVFVSLLVRTLKDLRHVQLRAHVAHPTQSPLLQMAALASALEISLWGYITGGFFLSQAYSTLFYFVIALSVACTRQAESSKALK